MTSAQKVDVLGFDDSGINEPYFDGFARTYDRVAKKQRLTSPSIIAKEVSRLLPHDCGSIKFLDAGIGTGLLSKQINKAFPDSQITGVDFSAPMLKKVKAKGIVERVRLLDLQVDALPFDDGEYDGVGASAVFEYIENPEFTISEMTRVTKRGGVISLTTLQGDEEEEARTVPIVQGGWLTPRVVEIFHSKSKIVGALENVGVEVLSQKTFEAYTHMRQSIQYTVFSGRLL